MKFDPAERTLEFSSEREIQDFHAQLSEAIRACMVEATRHIEDPEQAKAVSQKRMQELSALMRALNSIRKTLPRKSFD